MLTTNTNFDTYHDVDYTQPMYIITFEGQPYSFSNHLPLGSFHGVKQYLQIPTGISQKITPNEGKSSISSFTFSLQDIDDEITEMIVADEFFFDNKRVSLKGGYAGMSEEDCLLLSTGWVKSLKMSSDLTAYTFTATDPQKQMIRKVFRGSEDSTVNIAGNPLNIALNIILSTGNGTNGDYDRLAAVNGIGLSEDFVNVSNIELIRDRWFPGNSWWMEFEINKRIKAKDFLEKEIYKPLCLYPVINGDGKFDLRPYKPPLPGLDTVQSFSEANIIGMPQWDSNLKELVNEVEISYNYDLTSDTFQNVTYYVDGDSVTGRGAGDRPVEIKTKGLKTDSNIATINNRTLARYATPPIKINFKTRFDRFLSEAGDIVPFSHNLLPDLSNSVRGYSNQNMEVVSRNVDWKKGLCTFELLDTGFGRLKYGTISPSMTVTSGSSSTVFFVSTTDAAKYTIGWEVHITNKYAVKQAGPITITDIDTDTGQITTDDIGATPQAGWVVNFANYSEVITRQKDFTFIGTTDYIIP